MTTLSGRDCRAVLGFVEGLHACREPGALARYVVHRTPSLIGTCQTTWNVIAPGQGGAQVVVWPPPPDPEATTRVFARHLLDHPGIVHYLRSGTVRATTISDFLSARAFARSTIYGALYRDLGYADQLAVFLAPPGPEVVGLALGRARRGYTARDRAVLERLRAHLLHAHRTTTALARRDVPPGDHAHAWLVDLTQDARPRLAGAPPGARACLRRHFGEGGDGGRGLPEALARWCAAQAGAPDRPATLRRLTGGDELRVRYLPGGADNAPGLLIEERIAAPPAGLRVPGLSAREAQVLDAVARGLTNAQIGAALGIRAGTVRKHLEHAYARLGVRNRTAAVAAARALAGAPHAPLSRD
jgi:DNA-binding CsgD family transcriptional regulator